MKIIKSLLLTTVCLLTAGLLQAQEKMTAEKTKPVESVVPAPGSKPALAPDLKPVPAGRPAGELKIMEAENITAPGTKPEEMKPQLVPVSKPLAYSASTLQGDKRENGAYPPKVLPAQNSTIPVPPPVKPEMKKPATVRQQVQN